MKLGKHPKDERISAEVNRYYKKGFWILSIGILLDIYLQLSAAQITDTSLSLTFRPLEYGAALIAFLYCCIQTTRNGIFDDDLRYADTDTFPKRYSVKISLLSACIASFVLVGGRIYNEIIYRGIEHVTWMPDLIGFITFAIIVFLCIYSSLYLVWRIASHRRKKMEEDFTE